MACMLSHVMSGVNGHPPQLMEVFRTQDRLRRPENSHIRMTILSRTISPSPTSTRPSQSRLTDARRRFPLDPLNARGAIPTATVLGRQAIRPIQSAARAFLLDVRARPSLSFSSCPLPLQRRMRVHRLVLSTGVPCLFAQHAFGRTPGSRMPEDLPVGPQLYCRHIARQHPRRSTLKWPASLPSSIYVWRVQGRPSNPRSATTTVSEKRVVSPSSGLPKL